MAMRRYTAAMLLPVLVSALGGCMVTQPQNTPVAQRRLVEPATSRGYWLYVPSYYSPNRQWPLVVTLHGGWLWDSSESQIREWKHLAEKHGLIVAAPDLESSQMWVILRDGWMADLAADEKAVLAVIADVSGKYRIAKGRTLLTGFLEGGYALYYIGLRNAGSLAALVARDCYTDMEMMDGIELTDAARNLPMLIFNGKHGWGRLSAHGWDAFRFLRENRCYQADRKEVAGGQLRRPKRAYRFWAPHLPPELRR